MVVTWGALALLVLGVIAVGLLLSFLASIPFDHY